MDEEPIPPKHKIFEHAPTKSAAPIPAGSDAPQPAPVPTTSPFTPKPAVEVSDLPAVQDHDRLRLATSGIVQQGLSLDEAADRYGVDPDALHVWHRTYVKFIGKDLFAATSSSAPDRIQIDQETSRKFDDNWTEMMRLAELERPQLSPLHKRLLSSPFTGWMFRDEKLDNVTVLGAIAVLAFSALAIRAGTQHLGERNSNKEADKTSDEQTKTFDPSDPKLLEGDQTEVALGQIAGVLEKFAALETWQERLSYVRNPERVKPLMEEYYQNHDDGPMNELVISPEVSFIKRNETTFVLIQGNQLVPGGSNGERERVLFLAELLKGDPCALFDWEVLVNYQPVSWEEFATSKRTASSPFRVRVTVGDYWNQPFWNKDEYASFALQPLGQDRIIHGFIRRLSDLEKQLEFNIAKELRGNRAMILNLRYPENAKYDDIVEIESIAADSWLGE